MKLDQPHTEVVFDRDKLYAQGRVATGQFAVFAPDFVLGLLFVAAYRKTSPEGGSGRP